MQGHEIRKKFLEFFEKNRHAVIPSSSLLPLGDPTLLFTNAGMVQFKDVFTGQAHRDYQRAASSQKCVRAGGKHNDLENVGFTPRHHTFFEMLGNFSFGDYFKREAMEFAWEFLTKVVKLDPDKLSITIFRDDDEAEELWHKHIGIPKKRITRHDEKDNFWAMGDTGPCGPCSEIFYDFGPEMDADNRYIEIWNLVFMQFNRTADGKMTPLPNPSIDTGMGLERLAAVLQGVKSNFDTDFFQPIIKEAARLAGTAYGKNPESDISLRVIADHARATTFLISDGALPSNEGAGYVLRRIMRRAIRHGKKLGMEKPFFYEVCSAVVKLMNAPYPELKKNTELIAKVARREEEQFAETLGHGLGLLDEEMRRAAKGKKVLSGDVIFKLYDTYGFPVDLTRTIADEKGFAMDMEGFEKEMTVQRERSQKSGKGLGKSEEQTGAAPVHRISIDVKKNTPAVRFLGYQALKGQGKVVEIASEGKPLAPGKEAALIVDETPFYGEAGGQMGDTGRITSTDGFEFEVTDTTKPLPHVIVHHGKVRKGTLRQGETVSLAVDAARRRQILLNHSATHLVHAALRTILGKHVHQKGSLVAPDRLRFDFTHFEATDPGALREIENLCNEHVRLNHPVETREMDYDAAVKTGAMALFGEKYGDRVRVVSMSDFSVELCGGTHVTATGEIGFIRFRHEAGVASGVRRLEALTGQGALDFVRTHEEQLQQIARRLKSSAQAHDIEQKIEKLLTQQKDLETALKKKPAASPDDLLSKVKEINGVKVLAEKIDNADPKALRDLADQYKAQIKSGVVALGTVRDNKVSLIVSVSDDLTGRIRAGDLVKSMAAHVGGTGGGRADMAQAGGTNPAGLDEALAALTTLLS